MRQYLPIVPTLNGWHTGEATGTLYLKEGQNGRLMFQQGFPIAALECGDQATVVIGLDPSLSEDDLDGLTVFLDSGGILDEQDEGNNWYALQGTETLYRPLIMRGSQEGGLGQGLSGPRELGSASVVPVIDHRLPVHRPAPP